MKFDYRTKLFVHDVFIIIWLNFFLGRAKINNVKL